MKHKWFIPGILLLAFCIAAPSVSNAQEKKKTTKTEVAKDAKQGKKFKVDDKFMSTWKKVGSLTKEIRSFKTEKSTTVAGVRGAEAEDEAMKHLYYKGGAKYPSRMELKNAILLLENYIGESKKGTDLAESYFFVGQCNVQLGDLAKGKTAFEELVTKYPDSDYVEMAKAELKKLEKK